MRRRRLSTAGRIALSGLFTPAVIGIGIGVENVGHAVIGGIVCVYGIVWGVIAVAMLVTTDGSVYMVELPADDSDEVRCLRAELAAERALREKFQNALTDGRP